MSFKKITGLVLIVAFAFSCKRPNESEKTAPIESQSIIFPKGEKISNNNFTGTAWLSMLVVNDTTYNTQIGNVTFEPGVRTK